MRCTGCYLHSCLYKTYLHVSTNILCLAELVNSTPTGPQEVGSRPPNPTQNLMRRPSRSSTRLQILIRLVTATVPQGILRCWEKSWSLNIVPLSWLLECLQLSAVKNNVTKFLSSSTMKQGTTTLTANGQTPGEVKMNTGILQDVSLSPKLYLNWQ